MRLSALKTILAAGTIALSAAAASANELVVNVYEDGYLPNIAYVGGYSSVKFVNMTSKKVGIDYQGSRGWVILVDNIPQGTTFTVPVGDLWGRTIVQPYVFGRGYPGAGRFKIEAGTPPLQ